MGDKATYGIVVLNELCYMCKDIIPVDSRLKIYAPLKLDELKGGAWTDVNHDGKYSLKVLNVMGQSSLAKYPSTGIVH